LGTATRSTARILEAESGLRSGALRVEGTFEALGSCRSSEALEIGESSIRIGIRVIAIVVLLRMDPLAVIGSSICGASTTTSSS